MSSMTDNVLDSLPSTWNPDDVGQFRFEQFAKLGFGPELAAFLAETKIDWHRVQKWLAKGATPMQAVRLEAGKDWLNDDPDFDHLGFDRLMAAAVAVIPPGAPDPDPDTAIYLNFIRD